MRLTSVSILGKITGDRRSILTLPASGRLENDVQILDCQRHHRRDEATGC